MSYNFIKSNSLYGILFKTVQFIYLLYSILTCYEDFMFAIIYSIVSIGQYVNVRSRAFNFNEILL